MPKLRCTTLILEHAGGVLPVNIATDVRSVARMLTFPREHRPPILTFTSPTGDRVLLPADVISRLVVMYDNEIEMRDPRIAVPEGRTV